MSVGYAEGTNPECNGARELGGEESFGSELTEDGRGVGFLSAAENLLGWTDDGSGGCRTVDSNDNGDNIEGVDAFLVALAPPEITVDKSATPASRPEPGGEFTFNVVVTNTGDRDTTISSLMDDVYGDLTTRADSTCDSAPGTVLAPDESYSCAFSVQFTGNAGASQTDTVTATAEDDFGSTIAAGSATISITAAPATSPPTSPGPPASPGPVASPASGGAPSSEGRAPLARTGASLREQLRLGLMLTLGGALLVGASRPLARRRDQLALPPEPEPDSTEVRRIKIRIKASSGAPGSRCR
jgi:hypothetical protein